MTRDQKIQQTIELVGLMICGYFSQENRKLTGLAKEAWVKIFENCYQGIDAMIKRGEELETESEAKT